MKKDYVPVERQESAADETTFVERFWTENWKDHTRPPDVSELVRREEYVLIRPFLERLPRQSRILDGGCGLGEWTVFLAQQGFDVVGLDLSSQVVERLKSWFPERQFAQGDIRQTGFDSASFDAYLSWGTFEHFENGLGGCLAEAHRLLRSGGWLFVSVPFQNWRHILRDSRRLERWDPDFTRQNGYRQARRFYQWRLTRPELQRELERHGFRTECLTPIGKLAGVGRMMQWDVRLFRPGSRAFGLARRALASVIPAAYAGHMILAVAQRR